MALFTLFACSNTPDTLPNAKTSALDSILGEKLLDSANKKIRPDNFKQLYQITEKQLNVKSDLYDVKPFAENYYLVKQKRNYRLARHFNLLLKTAGGKVSGFWVVNDFSVRDIQSTSDGLLLLCSNYDNKNTYRKSEPGLLILKLDKELRENWRYQAAAPGFPIQAETIKPGANDDSYILNLITACHVCYNVVELKLSKTGHFISVKNTELIHTEQEISQQTLHKFFRQDSLTKSFN